MGFSALEIPIIDPEYVNEMREQGFSVARQVIPVEIYSGLVDLATNKAGRQLDLSDEATNQQFDITDNTRKIALSVYEAFFQAGLTEWKPNLSTFLKNGPLQNPHADNPRYKYGVALAYLSGELDMQVASTYSGLGLETTIKGIEPGDVVFLRAIEPEVQHCNFTSDGRTWHNAIGSDRRMLHLGYEK